MDDRILEVFESITVCDIETETSLNSPQPISYAAKRKMDDLLELGADAFPFAEHARFLYKNMLKALETERNAGTTPAKRPKGFITSIFSGESSAELPPEKPKVSSGDRRAQLRALIYLMGKFCGTKKTRRPEFIDILQEFSQTGHSGVFDDSKAILKGLEISEEIEWEAAIRSLPVSPEQPYETAMEIPEVLRTIRNTASFLTVSRHVTGNHFCLGSTQTHKQSIYRIAANAWVLRITRLNDMSADAIDDIIDGLVARLLDLVAKSSKVQDLEVGREQAREIGEKLNSIGGFKLMRNIAHIASDQGKKQGQPYALGYIERWWDGIGDWIF